MRYGAWNRARSAAIRVWPSRTASSISRSERVCCAASGADAAATTIASGRSACRRTAPSVRKYGGHRPAVLGRAETLPEIRFGLRENLDDDATVLGATRARVVRRDRLVFTVADHVDLVQRDLVLLVEVPLHRFGALEAEPLVGRLGAGVVGVPFDLDEDVVRVRLQLRDYFIEAHLRRVWQVGLAELEIALIFAEGDGVDKPPRRRDNLVNAATDRRYLSSHFSGFRRRGIRRRARILGRTTGRFGFLVDLADTPFVLTRPLLRFLERAAQRVDLRIDTADLGPHELLGGTGRGHCDAKREHRCRKQTLPHGLCSPLTTTDCRLAIATGRTCTRSAHEQPGFSSGFEFRAGATLAVFPARK